MIGTINEVEIGKRPDIPRGIAELIRPFQRQLDGKSLFIAGAREDRMGSYPADSKYDVVVLPGLLETAASPQLVLAGAAAMLNTGGAIIVATANGLGAGNIGEGSVTRLGSRQLKKILSQAGFGNCHFYYPFPDFRRPSILLSDAAFDDRLLDIGNLIEPVLAANAEGRQCHRPLIRALLDNGLMKELSDHFFIVVSDNPEWIPEPGVLAWTFNPGRVAAFRKMNTFYRDKDKVLMVRREACDAVQENAGAGLVRQELRDERYQPGRLYSLELADILCSAGWSVVDVVGWARPYLRLLRRHLMAADGGEWIEGRYLDLVPFNLLTDGQKLTVIDMEWVTGDRLSLQYVLFRGIYHSLARIGKVAIPDAGTPLNIYSLCLAVAEQLVSDTDGMLETFLALEPRYFGGVFTGTGGPPGDIDLKIAGRKGEETAAVPSGSGDRLYPLFNLNLQVFLESPDRPFSEETSAVLQIGLTDRRKVYSMHLPYFTGEITRLRVDLSDHCGLVQIYALHLRGEGDDLFYWTPWSRTGVELTGMMILNAAPSLPGPVTILLNHDPMLIFTLPPMIRKMPLAPIILEIEASALPRDLSDELLNHFQHLSNMLPEK